MICIRCNFDKNREEMAISLSHSKWCRKCEIEYYKNYTKEVRSKKSNYIKKAMEWKKFNRNKVSAHSALRHAIRSGKVDPKQRCYFCLTFRSIVGHHTDYSKPLDVLWICRSCHQKLHHVMLITQI